jgi:hypothetical protein
MISQSNNTSLYGFVYKTILPDGRYYIGQHKVISKRTLDPSYLGSGVIIKDYIKSKGREGIKREILAFGINMDYLNILENSFITEEVLRDPLNINLDKGGKNKFSRWPEVNNKIGKTISKLRTENSDNWPSRKGKDNNRSVNWKLISPTGQEFYLCGTLNDFCEKMGISANTIKKAVREGWLPKRGSCAGWQAFNLDEGIGTIRDTKNHGSAITGKNNPWYTSKNK